jgi:hypothetical protein
MGVYAPKLSPWVNENPTIPCGIDASHRIFDHPSARFRTLGIVPLTSSGG